MSDLRVTNLKGRTPGAAPILPDGAVVTGVVTATTFSGNLTGTASTASFATTSFGLSGNPSISVTGINASGITTVSAGSTSAPSISPSGDSNTGIFFPSADTINASTGGTSRITIDSNGNITLTNNFYVPLGSAASPSISFTSDTDTGIYSPGADQLAISTNGSGRLFVDSSGRLLVGTSSARSNLFNTSITSNIFQVEGAANSTGISVVTNGNTGETAYLAFCRSKGTTIGSNTLVSNGDVLGTLTFQGSDGTEFVDGARIEAYVDGIPGANDMPGRLVFSTTADGAATPTERMRITSAGGLLFGKTTNEGSQAVKGVEIGSSGYILNVRDSDVPLFVNRLTNDGVLINLSQDGTAEGTISVSGTTVSYNGAHLSRWSQIQDVDPYDKDQRPEILRGTVMSNLDEMCDWICPESGECQDNEQLNKTKISDVEDDPNVAGVFQSWDDDDDTWVNDYYLAMTGDFVIRIAEGVTVQRGDLLISAGDGTARPQGDRYLKDSTIAKVTSTNVSCTYEDGSYCVPCVLMAC